MTDFLTTVALNTLRETRMVELARVVGEDRDERDEREERS
jgi:hypothetical protein